MIGATIDFGPSIQAHAKSRNRVLRQDEVEHLAATLNSVAEIEAGDHPVMSFTLGGDRRGDLHQALDLYGEGFGSPAGAETSRTSTVPSALKPEAQSATQQAIARNAELRAQTKVGIYKRNQAQEVVQKFGNPWLTKNRTHQAFIANAAPDLVAGLKAEAGIR